MRTYFLRTPTFAARLMPNVIWDLGGRSNCINLSFDDGPYPNSTVPLLKLLDKHKMKATFFLLGEQVVKYPQLYQEIKAEGHQIGSHGYKHLNGWNTRSDLYVQNALKGAEVAESRLYRPPYGRISWPQYRAISPQLKIVMWSLMTGDFDPQIDSLTHGTRIRSLVKGRDIIVMHDNPQVKSLHSSALEVISEVMQAKQWESSII